MAEGGKSSSLLPPGGLSMGGSIRLQFGAPAPAPWWAKPMNSQALRLEMVRQLIARCGIQRVVETGTFLGTTTEFFAQLGLPVTTAENNPEFAAQARERLRRWPNVDFQQANSVQVLQKLVRDPIDRGVPTLFYLDAHWENHLPLREEAELAFGHFAKAVVLVDDFVVPGDAGYGFDDYGPGKRLDLDYLLRGALPPLSIYFPAAPSQQETGARRGCVVATADAAIAVILDGLPQLRRWTT